MLALRFMLALYSCSSIDPTAYAILQTQWELTHAHESAVWPNCTRSLKLKRARSIEDYETTQGAGCNAKRRDTLPIYPLVKHSAAAGSAVYRGGLCSLEALPWA